uniref:Uncharacterized protein n=1 Tax=Salix viminalis TaxID=40686 RepID=A0A6N2L6P7_SALVM
MRSSKGTSGLREATGESVSGTEREARGGERREGDVLGLGKRLLGCREQRSFLHLTAKIVGHEIEQANTGTTFSNASQNTRGRSATTN